MNVCGRCGAGQTPGLRYCTACGADLEAWSAGARPDGPRLSLPLVVTALVVVAITVVAASVVAVRYSNRRVTGVATAAEAGVPTVPVPSWTWTPPPGTTTPAPPTARALSPDEIARGHLDARVATDRAAVEALVGRWVPQLSSKRLGLVVDGVPFTHEDIWRDFQLTAARYPNALLLSSADFVSFDSGDFWVTVVPYTYATGAEANAWCDRERIGPDDCFAKRLSHTGTSDGTTLPRR
ncbi:zinc ribbon domain-containing protein [Saccharothrix sp. S26]|uniref:zinc ribbon domain-containing protein n=1 Tax=Saccharothrix sp. S26 TaxID=2907215 RepID=UPI001F332C44|nr:zinc ribbon domain-containing protein [Saccharothrix sp. S26]MCE6998025.1 zinc ribbon domain-containing protein [Saccharothrix sp. S26]